jgi:hypothetical protein
MIPVLDLMSTTVLISLDEEDKRWGEVEYIVDLKFFIKVINSTFAHRNT